MGIVEAASFLTAFIAGVAALFSPCCIGVLLPSYLASVFKTKTKIFLMTFVYYLGLLTIFLPLGLGAAGLSTFFSRNHVWLFTAGGLFMVIMGVALLLGKSVMLPMRIHPKLEKYDFGSIYTLGIFSGIATTCCAPVLAGVLALSAMPGSFVLGGLYSLTFVTGMIVPLLIMAVLVDRTDIDRRFKRIRRRVSYQLGGKSISLSISHLISGSIFIVFGLFILTFERANPDAMGSNYQVEINLLAARATRAMANLFSVFPQSFWATVFSGLFVLIAWRAYRQASDEVKRGTKQ